MGGERDLFGQFQRPLEFNSQGTLQLPVIGDTTGGANCVAPGDSRVRAMCRGRHRVENRMGMRHTTYFADRTVIFVQIVPLCLGKVSWVTKPRAHHSTAVLSELDNLRMTPASFLLQRGRRRRPRDSRDRAPVNVQREPKDSDGVAHQQLQSSFAITYEDRMAWPRLRASETKASRSLRILRLDTSDIGGKLAREVKATDMENLQAVIYLTKGARVM